MDISDGGGQGGHTRWSGKDIRTEFGGFYADYGLLGSRELVWIHVALNFLIGMFPWIGLAVNVAKSNMIMCHPGAIISGVLEEVFSWCSKGKGETY